MTRILARVRSFLAAITAGRALDDEMHAEFEHHMELRAGDLVKSGVPPEEARRRARAEFGGAYNQKEAGREARGLRWFDAFRISWLDVKLGARMVYRYPGLTVVSALAMGVAIAIGAGVMGVIALREAACGRAGRDRSRRAATPTWIASSRCSIASSGSL